MILVLVAGGSSAALLPEAAGVQAQGHGHSATAADPRNREHWAATGGNSGVLVFGLQLSAQHRQKPISHETS